MCGEARFEVEVIEVGETEYAAVEGDVMWMSRLLNPSVGWCGEH